VRSGKQWPSPSSHFQAYGRENGLPFVKDRMSLYSRLRRQKKMIVKDKDILHEIPLKGDLMPI
jgi:hypothetical protein